MSNRGKKGLSWAERARLWDIEYGLPRPADAQHLPSYQAFLRLLEDLGAAARSLLLGLGAAAIIYITASYILQLHGEWLLLCVIAAVFAFMMGIVEASVRFIPYYRVNQRTSYGSTRWATADDLESAGQLHVRDLIPEGHIRIGGFGRDRVVTLGGADEALVSWLQHVVLFGPPRSGKSKTFLMTAINDALTGGASVVVLDPKGELYEHTAGKAAITYRLDLQDPRLSDRWNFLSECASSPEFAHQMAATIIGLEGTKQSVQDPFWPTSETAALTALLMYIADEFGDQRPETPMVYDLAALMPTEELVKAIENSKSYEVRTAWGAFTKAAQQTRDSILTGLMTNLHPFQIDAARAVMAYPTEEERRRGVKLIDFAKLRQPGTAVYIVIPEGDATRYKPVLTTFIGHVVTFLRRDGYVPGKGAPVLFVLDEAGNVPIVGLKELVGVGRGRGIGFYLGYQNISMVYDQYGRDGGDAILGAIATHIYLPGIDPVTAEAAVKRIGQTTVLSRSDIDSESDNYDQTRLQETGRALIDASELRQLVPYRQAVVVMGSLPPVKITYPSMATVENPLRLVPVGTPRPRRLYQLNLREDLRNALRVNGLEETASSVASSTASSLSASSASDGAGEASVGERQRYSSMRADGAASAPEAAQADLSQRLRGDKIRAYETAVNLRSVMIVDRDLESKSDRDITELSLEEERISEQVSAYIEEPAKTNEVMTASGLGWEAFWRLAATSPADGSAGEGRDVVAADGENRALIEDASSSADSVPFGASAVQSNMGDLSGGGNGQNVEEVAQGGFGLMKQLDALERSLATERDAVRQVASDQAAHPCDRDEAHNPGIVSLRAAAERSLAFDPAEVLRSALGESFRVTAYSQTEKKEEKKSAA